METTMPHSTSTAPPPPIPRKTFRLTFHGTGGALFGIFIMNLLKTICTLGIYFFWGKVRTRQFIWGQTEFAGDRFGYHGTGLELFLGWLKAALLFGGIIALQNAVGLGGHPALGAAILWIGLAFLVPIAQIGALRYRLSRSSWRSVRFSFQGEVQPFLIMSIRGLILTALTLGVFYPFYECESRGYLIRHCRFGSFKFEFDGKPLDLFWIYVKHILAGMAGAATMFALIFAWRDKSPLQSGDPAAMMAAVFSMILPLILVYGIVLLSLAVKRRQFYWHHTSFAGARFKTTVTMGNLFGLYATNLLLLAATLGLAFPWITVRSRQYDCDHLTLTGALDLNAIQQDARTATAVGEELSGFLDVDAMTG